MFALTASGAQTPLLILVDDSLAAHTPGLVRMIFCCYQVVLAIRTLESETIV